ncbi:MAG: DNA repair protein RecN, partial [Gammaproteobacteria bacterium]|nr:DNA repair protein RecN [Gammaproteobacteria bacterium]
DQRAATATCFSEWTAVADRLSQLLDADANRASRLDLLTFQLQELETLAPQEGEIDELGRERQILQNSGRLVAGISATLDALMDGDTGNANSLISEAVRSLNALAQFDPALGPLIEMLDSAAIQVSETAETLRRYGDNIDMDPQRRDWVEERLDALQAVARKHRTSPNELPALQQRLQQEFEELTNSAERGRELELQSAALKKQYLAKAAALSDARSKAAISFSAAVTDAMSSLGMPGGVFEVAVARRDESSARPWGMDDIEFRISANPGQKPQPLAKIASGGELSRMSLAIQVIASDGSSIPTMVFDEVDSGVGGAVAEMVGRRLQEIGEHRQVLCVTHLPQVASLADQHFRISKVSDGKSTRTGVQMLGKDERIQELARMLGGVEITRKTLEHAEEMLAGARQTLTESNAG